jgi:hypothetical protein
MDEAVLVLDMVEDMLMFELWKAEVVFCADTVGKAGYGGRDDALDRSIISARAKAQANSGTGSARKAWGICPYRKNRDVLTARRVSPARQRCLKVYNNVPGRPMIRRRCLMF